MGTSRFPVPLAVSATSARARSTAGLVTRGAHGPGAIDLELLELHVDREDLGLLRFRVGEPVDPDHHLLAVVHRLGKAVGRRLDLLLHEPSLDRGNGAAQLLDPLEVDIGRRLHLVGERLNEVRARQRVDGVGHT